MKVSKNIIIITLIFCIVSGGIIVLLEFNNQVVDNMSFIKSHLEFFLNVCLSLFASGVLVLVPSITQYSTEKKRYHNEMQKNLNGMLYHSREIIKCVDSYSQDNTIHMHFESFRILYKELINRYSTFTHFFIFSGKDKLIETVITDMMKFILVNEEILKYAKLLKKNEISEKDYNNCFEIARGEMLNYYKVNFDKYQNLVDELMTNDISKKKLKKYF